MGMMDRVNMAVSALQLSGFPTMRGYPEKLLPDFTDPRAAVTVARSDQRQTELAVTIFGPKGRECEQKAQLAADVLRAKGASCRVGSCDFDGASNLFSVKITVLWMENLHNKVKINNETLLYATAFSAVQTRQVEKAEGSEAGVVNEGAVWTVAIQELLPFQETMGVEHKDAFTLRVLHENCTEVYPNCYWISITLEEGDGGLVRKRIARSWTERIIEPKT